MEVAEQTGEMVRDGSCMTSLQLRLLTKLCPRPSNAGPVSFVKQGSIKLSGATWLVSPHVPSFNL